MADFWNRTSVEPKRNFKFLLSIPGGAGVGPGIAEFLVQKVAKPSMETTATEHTFLNHFFYFPGKSKWLPIEVTCVDLVRPLEQNMSQVIMKMVDRSGYQLPTTIDSSNSKSLNSMSKSGATSALGTVTIKTLDSVGNVVEEWALENSWIQKVAFSELDYSNEDLTTCTMTIQYDFASLKVGGLQIPDASPSVT